MRSWLLLFFMLGSTIAMAQFGAYNSKNKNRNRYRESLNKKQRIPQSMPYAFQKGDFLANFGMSVGARKSDTEPNVYRQSSFPPLSLSVEYGLSNVISIGPYVSFYSRTFKYDTEKLSYDFRSNAYYAGLKTSLHFSPLIEDRLVQDMDSEHLDLYLAFTAGKKGMLFGTRSEGLNNKYTGSAMLGMRYIFDEHFGLYAEVGYGPFEIATGGVTARF